MALSQSPICSFNLHSSMERLKEYFSPIGLWGDYDLHSSMERLKGLCGVLGQNPRWYLHSSMERLKVGGDAVETVGIHEFTFQYGEIKSPPGFRLSEHICTFTFQYGEIKRALFAAL